ncbi:MAG: cytochrome c biogenesis protein CcsA [Methylococcus sp.]|jgi:ABC-type uncharacterized transport system permease subunit
MPIPAYTSITILTYLMALGALLQSIRITKKKGPSLRGDTHWHSLSLGALAVGTHGWLLFEANLGPEGLNVSFMSALSLVSFGINAILVLAALIRPIDKLGLVTYPIALIILTLTLLYQEPARTLSDQGPAMTTHILASLMAYSLLNIAAIQALLLALQEACLRRRNPSGLLIRSLPSLESMETLMFQLIAAGWVVLGLSLLTGFIFLDNLFAQHLAHKTILSILAWLVFLGLLLGRIRYGWRGQFAIRWTLLGFAFLMLAYFGSKLVIELILHRV